MCSPDAFAAKGQVISRVLVARTHSMLRLNFKTQQREREVERGVRGCSEGNATAGGRET